MENFVKDNIEFEDEKLNKLLKTLRSCYVKQQNNFAELCFCISRIHEYFENNYFKAKDNEYYNEKKLLKKFGFNRQAVSRYIHCFKRFCYLTSSEDDAKCFVISDFYGFSPSKLFELLVLSNEEILKYLKTGEIKFSMTVKELRKFIKSLYSESEEQMIEIKEEEIPDAYDPTKVYDYSYFEGKSKNQLLNIVWELQNYLKKIKRSK